MTQKTVHLTIENSFGSVEHYYHFFLGFLLPLIYWYTYIKKENYSKIMIRSCEIMDKHLNFINIPELIIMNKNEHKEIKNRGDKDIEFISIVGFDNPTINNSHEINFAKKSLLNLLKFNYVENNIKNKYPTIALIDRKKSDPFYLSNNSEIKFSGSDKRSIPNFDQLVKSISNLNPIVYYLEDSSLEEQIKIFKDSDIIIAQHGASLSNIIFCKKNTFVVEICHQSLIDTFLEIGIDLYKDLSLQMNLKFFRIIQSHNHSEIDPNKFSLFVNNLIKSFKFKKTISY